MKRLLALGLLLAAAAAGEPEVLTDEWQVLRLFGVDAGYVHLRVVREDCIVETTSETNMVIKRAGAEMRIEQTDTTEECETHGSLMKIRSVRKMSAYETETVVTFEGTKARVLTKIAGKGRETMQECGEGLVGPYRLDQLTRETGFRKGATVEARTYLSDLGGPAEIVVTVGDAEEVELLDGSKKTLVRVETLFPKIKLKPINWVDASGSPVKTRVSVGGLDMESFAATEERARRAAGTPPAPLPDAFANTLLAPLHPIPSPRLLDRATYRIRAKNEMPDLADERQVVERREGDAILLRIDRKVPPPGAGKRPAADVPAELASSLAPNSMVQSDAPEIAEIVGRVAGGESDAWRAAQALERWVHDNITEKSMDVGFASALEVCRDRKGDCTEHAVLLCALCRAAGIPSRVVMGLTCIGNAFGGHAWTEVWIGGSWYALDGTLGQGSVDPTHITLARMTLEDAAGAEAFLGLVQGLGNLEIDPVEVVLGGKTVRPADDAGRTEGDRFESRLWGIAFTRPAGFDFRPPGGDASMLAPIMGLAGDGTTILVSVTDAAAFDMVRAVAKDAFDSCEETKVDGRPALRVAKGDRRGVYALTERGVFVFDMRPVKDAAAEAAFESLLASVDFDVK